MYITQRVRYRHRLRLLIAAEVGLAVIGGLWLEIKEVEQLPYLVTGSNSATLPVEAIITRVPTLLLYHQVLVHYDNSLLRMRIKWQT
jgi:hypothetical protein